ncbi:MAG: hypothetical protein AAGI68_09460 [Planctomycetota bacterium]
MPQDWITVALYCFVGALCLIALVYLAAPLLIQSQVAFDLNGTLREVALGGLSDADQHFFTRTSETLEPLGFLPLAHFVLEGMVPNVNATFQLLANPDTQALALALVMQPSAGPSKRSLEFASELAPRGKDPRIPINTTTSLDGLTPDADPVTVRHAFPELSSPDDLVRIHDAIVKDTLQTAGPTRTLTPIPFDREPAEFFLEEMARELDGKADRGFWQKPSPGRYTLTLTGAYLMTWSQFPPFKQLRDARHRRAAQAIRQRLGV